ncbi:MAG: hypothetical protein OXT67_13090 [Zetaproteobacteria bacterium]|nr:hypothetical protein [Zetaproteobacteria bacterium]
MTQRRRKFRLRPIHLPMSILLFSLHQGCVSLREEAETLPQPIPITDQTPLKLGLEEAVHFGGQTMQDMKQLLQIRGAQGSIEAGQHLEQMIRKNYRSWTAPRFINAIHLYLLYPSEQPQDLFKMLVQSKHTLAIRMGWHLAAALPTPKIAKAVEDILTEAIVDNTLTPQFVPDMADALVANQLRPLYTVARSGLFATHQSHFAKAMAFLKPDQSRNDFLEYLALASAEELRQLNLTSVDMFTCMEILQQLDKTPPPMNHRNFENLFYFAISRNTGLSTLARNVLKNFIPGENTNLALVLARQPIWVQAAFVEGSRRQLSPKLSLFLRELRDTTSQTDVIQEINTVIQ